MRIIDLWREGFRREIRGLKAIGTWIWETLRDGVTGIADKLKDVGKTIVTGLVNGLKGARKLFHDALRDLISSMPGGSLILKAIDATGGVAQGAVDFGKSIIGRATGGPIPGSGWGDVPPAMLTPGEHVWTKREVEGAGGHAVMYALRRIFGGGGQGGPFGYQDGGAPFRDLPTYGSTAAARDAGVQARDRQKALAS